jgi:hypothetical protein
MKISIYMTMLCAAFLAGCMNNDAPVADPVKPAEPGMTNDQALKHVRDYVKLRPHLARWTHGKPFFVGKWDDYTAACSRQGLVYLIGWRPVHNETVVVYRQSVLASGGREDIFKVNPKNRRVEHIVGATGR